MAQMLDKVVAVLWVAEERQAVLEGKVEVVTY